MKVHFVLLIGSQRAEGNSNRKLFGKLSIDIDKTFFPRTNRFCHQIKYFTSVVKHLFWKITDFTEKCPTSKNTG